MKKKKQISVFANVLFFSSLLFWSTNLQAQSVQTVTFAYTGLVQTFTVPNCVGTITVDARGGEGANANDKLLTNSSGGAGGRAVGIITVTPGQVLTIYVGGMGSQNGSGGFNGGGAGGNSTAGSSCFGGPAGGGGGASDVRVGGIGLSNRVIVGAGGGGAGRDYCNGSCQPCGCGGSGGGGGGLNGTIGQAAHNCGFSYPGGGVNGGAPGTQTAVGAGGPGDNGGNNGFTATLNIGGNGGDGQYDVAGGGGGGGYFGGGGGGAASNGSGVGGGGGGGGSSYISGLSAGTTTSSYQLGNGLVIFNYEFVSPLSSAIASPSLICSGGSSTLSAGGMTSYTWSPGSSGASSIVVSPSSTSSYTVAATSPLGCYQISVLTVTVNTLPPALSVSSSSTIICPTNTITLTASGAINYTWTGGVLNGIPFSPLTTSMYTVFAANGCGTVSATQGITVTPLPVVAIASPSTICTGNAATLTAAAATNYMWSPGILQGATVVVSPTASVVYTVTGTTSVCAGITTVALNVNPIPTVSAVSTNSSICAGSSVSLSASGALSYTWQPGGQTGSSISASPGVSTLFVVTGINSFSCTSTANQVVLVTPAPTLNLVASNTLICTGGSATLFVSGANSYNWSVPTTGASLAVNPLTSASYSVTGTNTATGCSASKAISISVYTRSISVSTSTVICLGNTITLNASGATSYTWSNGTQSSFNPVSPTISTVYQVNATTFTNNMYCTSNGSVSVTVNPLPSVIAAATRTSICRNETVTISATGATNYLWTNLMAVPSFTFKGTSIISYNYTVTGTNANGCSNTSTLTLKVNACTGMEELDALLGLQIFPNPSSAEFNINFKTLPKNMSIRIFNTLGHLVKTQEVVSEHTVVDLEKEANGVYLINFIQYDRSIQVSKIIKQ